MSYHLHCLFNLRAKTPTVLTALSFSLLIATTERMYSSPDCGNPTQYAVNCCPPWLLSTRIDAGEAVPLEQVILKVSTTLFIGTVHVAEMAVVLDWPGESSTASGTISKKSFNQNPWQVLSFITLIYRCLFIT